MLKIVVFGFTVMASVFQIITACVVSGFVLFVVVLIYT